MEKLGTWGPSFNNSQLMLGTLELSFFIVVVVTSENYLDDNYSLGDKVRERLRAINFFLC